MSYRWMAEITYTTGRAAKVVAFEEITELDEIIEFDPDGHEIDQIVITLNRPAIVLGALRGDRGAGRRAN